MYVLAPLQPLPKEKVIVAGSTWPDDEKLLLPAYAALKGQCKMILAPYEVDSSHLSSLKSQLENLGLSFCNYSSAASWTQEDILLIDQVGILAELYTWGSIAFVGGSFRKQAHSVMEPLAAGPPVVVGPYHHNNREALLFKEKSFHGLRVVTEVSDLKSLSLQLSYLLNGLSPDFQDSLHRELRQHLNSSQSVVKWCEKVLGNK